MPRYYVLDGQRYEVSHCDEGQCPFNYDQYYCKHPHPSFFEEDGECDEEGFPVDCPLKKQACRPP